jgi:hypothetical protein
MTDYHPSVPRHFSSVGAEIQWLKEEVPHLEDAIHHFTHSGGMASIVVNYQHALERRKNRFAELTGVAK